MSLRITSAAVMLFSTSCGLSGGGCDLPSPNIPPPTPVGPDGGTVVANSTGSVSSNLDGSDASSTGANADQDGGPSQSGLPAPSVTIPPGALTTTVGIFGTRWVNAPAPAGTTLVGPPVVFGPEGTAFQIPVTVTLPFDPSLLPAGATASQIQVFTAPLGTTDYVSLGGTIVGPETIQAQTTHFSVFAPAVPNAP
jgi:hypothetical protein